MIQFQGAFGSGLMVGLWLEKGGWILPLCALGFMVWFAFELVTNKESKA